MAAEEITHAMSSPDAMNAAVEAHKIDLAFHLWDSDGDGVASRKKLTRALTWYYRCGCMISRCYVSMLSHCHVSMLCHCCNGLPGSQPEVGILSHLHGQALLSDRQVTVLGCLCAKQQPAYSLEGLSRKGASVCSALSKDVRMTGR